MFIARRNDAVADDFRVRIDLARLHINIELLRIKLIDVEHVTASGYAPLFEKIKANSDNARAGGGS
jgi:hypothetical protein